MNRLIMHIVGNRPQFIKLAPISKEIRKRGYSEVIIHTGQHFDENMSDIFFKELELSEPSENLHVSGGSHTEMTARIMTALEPVVIKYNPRIVVIYGDTNSTLAAALVVRKLNIPIVHIEAGIRTGVSKNPEEVNRILVDHASEILCTPDRKSYKNLETEGLGAKSYFTGDVMYDAFCFYQNKVNVEHFMEKYGIERKQYIFMTWHRQENTTDIERMCQILNFVECIKRPIICPMHPRTYNKLKEYHLLDRALNMAGFHIIHPIGYLETIVLSSNSGMILTDSGGLSKESYFANVKCLFMLDLNIWPDLEEIGWIIKMSEDNEQNIHEIEQCFNANVENRQNKEMFYGDGHAAEKIIDLMEKFL